MSNYDILLAYLQIFSRPRYENDQLLPDGSEVLDCLAFGFSKLIEEIRFTSDLSVEDESLKLLDDLEARVCQVAYNSKHWITIQEWESVNLFAWKVIESLGLESSRTH